MLYDKPVFGHWDGNTKDIGFLKEVLPLAPRGDLTGDGHDGHPVHHCRGEAGDEVRCTGPAGRDAHAHSASRPRVPVCRMRGTLFVSHENVTEPLATMQRIVKGENGAPRVAKQE